jgi:hypothetical protein
MAPGRGRDHLCWWPLILNVFFLLVNTDSVAINLFTGGLIKHWVQTAPWVFMNSFLAG